MRLPLVFSKYLMPLYQPSQSLQLSSFNKYTFGFVTGINTSHLCPLTTNSVDIFNFDHNLSFNPYFMKNDKLV